MKGIILLAVLMLVGCNTHQEQPKKNYSNKCRHVNGMTLDEFIQSGCHVERKVARSL